MVMRLRPLQAGASPEARTQQLSLRRDKLLPKLQKVLLTVQCPDYRSKAPAHAREKMEAKVRVRGRRSGLGEPSDDVGGTFFVSDAEVAAGAEELGGADEEPEGATGGFGWGAGIKMSVLHRCRRLPSTSPRFSAGGCRERRPLVARDGTPLEPRSRGRVM